MAGSRIPGVVGASPPTAETDDVLTDRGFVNANPIGVDGSDAIELGTEPKISAVTRDWGDPPSVTPTFDPIVSAPDLKGVLAHLQQLPEWGTGGGNLKGTGASGELQAEPSNDGKSYTMALKGEFFLTLPKWTEYDKATPAQKKSWDDMFANLKKHEEEHVAISYRGAQKLIKSLTGAPVRLAAQKVSDSQTATQKDQDDFDSTVQTDHGKNDFGSFKKVFLDTTADPPPPPPPKKP